MPGMPLCGASYKQIQNNYRSKRDLLIKERLCRHLLVTILIYRKI